MARGTVTAHSQPRVGPVGRNRALSRSFLPCALSISVSKGILRVKGETKGERDGWEFCNRIEESIQLPASSIDEEGVTATTDHGVLSVVIPKLSMTDDTAAVRMIPVRSVAAEIEGK